MKSKHNPDYKFKPSQVLSDDMREAFTSDRNYRNKPNWLSNAVGDAIARCFAQHQKRRKPGLQIPESAMHKTRPGDSG